MKITVLLPTLNEEQGIVQTIQDIRTYLPEDDILVIDGLSTDKTVELARQQNVSVLMVKEKGKGIAVQKALKVIKTDYALMLDGDFTYPAKYIPEIIYNLNLGYDVVLGYRKTRERHSMTLINALGNKGLSLLASVVYRKYVYDVCTGMWGFNTYALQHLALQSDGFSLEADLFKNAVKNKCKIKQLPIEYRARLKQSKTKLNIGHGFEIGKFILRGL